MTPLSHWITNPNNLKSDSRVSGAIVGPWDRALKDAFHGLEFDREVGSKNPSKPNGYYTLQLQISPQARRSIAPSLHRHRSTAIAPSLHRSIAPTPTPTG